MSTLPWTEPQDISRWMDGQRRVVAFTGHRPDKLGGYAIPNPIYSSVIERLHAVLSLLRPHISEAVSGMALGVDQWAAELCLDLGIPWGAAIPCPGQERRWPEESKAKYYALLQHAAWAHTVSEHYHGGVMQVRNQWMVKKCHLLIAVWDGSAGGTYNCVEYARRIAHRDILRIHPYERTA